MTRKKSSPRSTAGSPILSPDPLTGYFPSSARDLQFKFGQTTIARQDIRRTVPHDESLQMLETVKKIVRELDPERRFFRIEDTGKDIEIMLTVSAGTGGDGDRTAGESGDLKDFDKGNGIAFLNRELSLGMEDGGTLICGDTRSDLPMVETALRKSPDTRAIFVTEDEELKSALAAAGGETLTVSTPDILVSILDSEGVQT